METRAPQGTEPPSLAPAVTQCIRVEAQVGLPVAVPVALVVAAGPGLLGQRRTGVAQRGHDRRSVSGLLPAS